MASLFFSYSHADEVLRDQLEKQLSVLKRQGVIEVWHDRRIDAGRDFAAEIDRHIETDDIILLLVSSDFLASDYCYDTEMKRAIERHDAGEAIVIPVILRACDWRGAPFGKLNATPPDGKPITQYPDRDHALLEVAKAVRAAANRVEPRHSAREPLPPHPSLQARRASTPRSSNLRLAKEFTDRDRDRFKHESFEYIAKFFENSLEELERRNPGIETGFRRVDANRFTAAVYKNGRAVSRCTVFIGGLGADGIAYLASESTESNAMNESLSIRNDEHDLYLKSLGMQRGTESHLSQEGAAEYYWSLLVERLQGK